MKKKNKDIILEIPSTSELEQELTRERYKSKYKSLFKSTFFTLFIVFAVCILVATFLFSVLKITGKSMNPTLFEHDIVISSKKREFKQGDVIAFYYNNRILVKRVIGKPLDWIKIDEDGNVFVNDKLLDEPYLVNKSLGQVDIEFPYQVPEDRYFVLGDERENSVDSRTSVIGSISEDEIIGKVFFKVWPIKRLGIVK